MLALRLRAEHFTTLLLAFAVAVWIGFGFFSFGRVMSGDSLALHMMVAKLTAASGTLERDWFSVNNEYYGLLGEMTYAALMLLANDDAAQIFTFVANLAAALVLLGICERCGLGVRGKTYALIMMFTSTAVLAWIGEGKIELFANSMGLAGIALLVPHRDGERLQRGDLVVSGLLTGFAVTCKLILGFCLAILALVLFSWTTLARSLKAVRAGQPFLRSVAAPTIVSGLIFTVAIVAGVVPQFVKNGALLGMPFAPLTLSHSEWFTSEIWYGPQTVAHIRLLYPLVLTFGEFFAQYGQMSPLVLGCLPLLLFVQRPRSVLKSPLIAVSVAAVAMIAAWALMFGDKVVPRYMLPALLLCIPAAARGAEAVTDLSFRPIFLGVVVTVFAATTLWFGARFAASYHYDLPKAFRTMTGLADPCERAWFWCRPMTAVNTAASPGARVLSVTRFKYYLRPDLLQCANERRSGAPVVIPGESAIERWRWIYNNGFSVILPDLSNNPAQLQGDLANAPAWVSIRRAAPEDPLDPIWLSFDLSKPGAPKGTPEIICKNLGGNRWRPIQSAGR